MADMIVYWEGSTFIEVLVGESDEQLKEAVDTMIVSIYRRIPEWLTYELGRHAERQGRNYREFVCRSGSVHFRLCINAEKNNLARGIILRRTNDTCPPSFYIQPHLK